MNTEKNKINMANLGNPLGPSPILELARKEIERQSGLINKDQARELLKLKLSDWLKVPTKMIGLGLGSSEIIDHLAEHYLANQNVILPVPTYFGIAETLDRIGTGIIETNLNDVEEIVKKSHEYNAAIWLCNPNNPTGTYFDITVLQSILDRAYGLVIVDEAYLEYIDPNNQESAVILASNHPNLVITKTYSKAFALPDIQMGIIIANPEVIDSIEPLCKPNEVENYLKARYVLDDMEHLIQFARWIELELMKIREGLLPLLSLEMNHHSVTGVMLLRHRVENLHQMLLDQGVESRDMNNERGIEGEQYVRIGLQLPEINNYFLDVLANL